MKQQIDTLERAIGQLAPLDHTHPDLPSKADILALRSELAHFADKVANSKTGKAYFLV